MKDAATGSIGEGNAIRRGRRLRSGIDRFSSFPATLRYLDLVSVLLKHNPDVRKQSTEGKGLVERFQQS